MTTLDDLVGRYGADHLVQIPVERHARILRVDPRTLSPEAVLPDEVPGLFTTAVDGTAALFDVVRVGWGTRALMLIVLGAVPADQDLLYCLDAGSGQVVLADPATPSIEPVNSTLALFVDFLVEFSDLMAVDQGAGPARSASALRLRERLAALDPAAFADPESWWQMAVAALRARN